MKHINSERGQSLVELAISIVILVYLLSGAVEFGLAFFQYVQLRDAAQEGALYGSMNPADSYNIDLRVRNASTSPVNLLDTSKVTVTQTIIGPQACEGNGIRVEVWYDHQIFMPFIPQFIGSSVIPLKATVTDTILSPVCPP
jgi:Flp pilus assembly protein TadG